MFKFGDRVIIIDGFYKGIMGRTIDYHEVTDEYLISCGLVPLGSHIQKEVDAWIKSNNLKKVI